MENKVENRPREAKGRLMKVIPITILLMMCCCIVGIAVGRGSQKGPSVSAMAGVNDEVTTPYEQEAEEPGQTDEGLNGGSDGADVGEVSGGEVTEAEPLPEEPRSSEGLVFESRGDGTCYVSGIGECRDSFIILPQKSPEGDIVIGISDYAFRGNTSVKGIEINDNIGYIGAYAFYGSALEGVVLSSETAFIGSYAFSNCQNLMAIFVDGGNLVYADIDGVLYDKELKRIICCPAGKTGNVFEMPSSVQRVETMAFYGCDSIKVVSYLGGAADFKSIQIGAGNAVIESAVKSYLVGKVSSEK